ncbi:redoxin domain-containing protein (plasmid) [Metabacillus halosaccharovorans]|uniref:redoxin domain-containing protein n=1 Tax=Metabacillus halosaccharovorans TaxID=930124 RepID=UPI00203EE14A|nr:redoxin domain-containing protein [Metabacillus halosaccharovorans]MCM3444139.1 redoxin domain-containing protein [Metabacillus halosaccharovorans]
MNFNEVSLFILWFVVILLLLLNCLLAKYIVEFLKSFRITGSQAAKLDLVVGKTAPLFREKDHLNKEIKLVDNDGKNTLLIFASNNCDYCKEIISGLPLITSHLDFRIIVISENKIDNYTDSTFDKIHFVTSKMILDNYFIMSVPSIILVDSKLNITLSKSVDSLHSLTLILGNYLNKNINYQNIEGEKVYNA